MTPLVLGIDIGTSGARAVAMDGQHQIAGQGAAALAEFGADRRDPSIWFAAVEAAMHRCLAQVDRRAVCALAVDGTSGTVLPVDATGTPVAQPLMYDDQVADRALLDRIAPIVPAHSAAHGPASGLAKMLFFQPIPRVSRVLHQADWIAGRLAGRFDFTDENNALKSGYDPVVGQWPDWLCQTGLRTEILPDVHPPGAPVAALSADMAERFGLSAAVQVIAGTTDGCASFIATGADRPGDAVTVLGSTMTLKLLCDRPIFAPQFGIYSHRILGHWLAGGASNSGGRVIGHYFDRVEIERLSAAIDPDVDSGLDYYPLLSPGERFPVADPALEPRLTPRPTRDEAFLHGLLEGIARIESRGYHQLESLGAPALKSVRSMGGGAANHTWSRMRQRILCVPLLETASAEAAAGSARLALAGVALQKSH